jgi:uncharacterized protein (TIGR02266 family)
MAPSDRRENTRTQVLLKVQYQEPQDLLSDYLTDLAEGGLFIRTSVPFALGQKISFAVSFPGLMDPMELQGIVRWRMESADAQPDDPAGVGVEFVFQSEDMRRQIAELVASFRAAPAVANKPSNEPFRVLLVEDNQFVHDLFKHAVKRFHREMPEMGTLEISSADNGQQALQHLEHHSVDLAIVDHFLPVMSGSELVTRMRDSAKYKTIPILVVSVGGEGVREQALQSGADLYLDKPVLLKQLLTTLRLLVTKRRFVSSILGSHPQ